MKGWKGHDSSTTSYASYTSRPIHEIISPDYPGQGLSVLSVLMMSMRWTSIPVIKFTWIIHESGLSLGSTDSKYPVLWIRLVIWFVMDISSNYNAYNCKNQTFFCNICLSITRYTHYTVILLKKLALHTLVLMNYVFFWIKIQRLV